MKSIVRVEDGDGLYGEQWNLSGDRHCLLSQGFNPKAAGCSFL
jgi:hypothetical protein